MRRSQSMWLNPDGSPCLCGHTICQIFHLSHNNVCLFVWKQRELKTFWTLIKFSGLFSFQPNRSHPPGRRVTIMLISHKTSFWAHRAIYELDILLIVFRSGLLCFLSMPSPFHPHYLHEVMGTWSVLLSCLWRVCLRVDVGVDVCVFTLRVAFPRRPLDAAHLAGDPPDLLRAAPPAAHPGPPQGLQLHPWGRVHRGAAHARPAAHVPDPASLQGSLVCM